MAVSDSEKAGRMPILPAHERHRVVAGFNDTFVDYDGPQMIHRWFEARVSIAPDAIAVRCGPTSITYGELDTWANRIAHQLVDMGVCVEDRVAIHVGRGPELVAGIMGVLKAGAAYVPLDPSYPKERLAFTLADCAARACLVTRAGGLPEGAENVPACFIDEDARASSVDAPVDAEARGLRPTSLGYVIYTSGSTGQPKGVMIEHANACNLIAWALRQDDVDVLGQTLFATSICFDLAVFEMFVPLAAGYTVHVARDVLASSADQAVTLLNTVPSGIAALLDTGNVPRTARRINLAGEPLRAPLVERLFASTSVETVGNLYGPTETTTYSTAVRIPRDGVFPPHIGKPIDNTRIYILDNAGEPVPIGVPGEIWIAGSGVARGYLGRPELTAERFGDDPFVPGGRAYRTGDTGRWLASGDIVYLGRNDHQVKVRGFRIEPGEIEAVLLRCTGVASAAVVAWGEDADSRRLVAYVVMSAGYDVSQASLREAISARLPAFMLPSGFMFLDALPLTPNGKLDRSGLPPPSFAAVETNYRAPEGVVEEALAEIWKELLGADRVGRDDHFFESGGHSLLAMQLLPRLRRTFQVDVPLELLFEVPVLRVIAERITAAQLKTFLSAEIDGMRDELDDLSEDQLLDLLNKESVDD
jgi:amino acid adenylation domain-containing protein